MSDQYQYQTSPQGQAPQQAPLPNQMPPQEPPKSASAIIALVLGIIALITSLIPIVNNMAFVLALIGAVFAVVGVVQTAKKKKSGTGMAAASLIINVLAIIMVIASQSFYSDAVDEAFDTTLDGSASSVSSTTSVDEQTDSQSSDGNDYAITDMATDVDSLGDFKITGTFTNTSGKQFNYVSLEFNLYDSDGAQIDSAYTSTSNLADGGTWKFEATSFTDAEDVASYELADVDAW